MPVTLAALPFTHARRTDLGEAERLLPQSALPSPDKPAAEERHRHGLIQWAVPPRFGLALVVAVLLAAALGTVFSESVMGRGLHQEADAPLRLIKQNPLDSRPSSGLAALDGAAADAGVGSSSGRSSDIGSSGEGSGDGGAESGAGDRPPNVIFILIDDVGMNDFGPHSTDLSMMTSFMGALAFDGVRLTRHYSNHICTPARVSFVCGRRAQLLYWRCFDCVLDFCCTAAQYCCLPSLLRVLWCNELTALL